MEAKATSCNDRAMAASRSLGSTCRHDHRATVGLDSRLRPSSGPPAPSDWVTITATCKNATCRFFSAHSRVRTAVCHCASVPMGRPGGVLGPRSRCPKPGDNVPTVTPGLCDMPRPACHCRMHNGETQGPEDTEPGPCWAHSTPAQSTGLQTAASCCPRWALDLLSGHRASR